MQITFYLFRFPDSFWDNIFALTVLLEQPLVLTYISGKCHKKWDIAKTLQS